MSPLYVDARRMFGDNVAEPGEAVVDFRAHVRSELGPAVRGIGSSVAARARGLAQRLNPPAPVELIEMPEDMFGGGWTPDADLNEED